MKAETIEKVIRLGRLLADITRHPLLSEALVLKGGTALNLCFGEPKRLSVDLDFNYVGKLESELMRTERPGVERAVETIGRGQGYAVQRSAEEHAGRKHFLGYVSAGGSRDRIEVDINYLFRQPLLPPVPLSVWQPGDLDRPMTAIAAFEEVAAGKLCALLDRAAPRDLYDAVHLPRLGKRAWKSARMRPIFVALAGTLPHPVHSYRQERLARVTDGVVRQELLPTLSRGEAVSARDLRQRSWAVVQPLLDLTKAEREYTDRVQKGELRPELLFPDDEEMAEKLNRHPALLWKVTNARAHAKRRR